MALFAYVFIPYNTFGEDVKMLKTSGMTTIKVLAIIMALWTASTSVADEIEGRTALTVLSKPVGRRQFILGKFLGIVWPIVLMFVILGLVFLLTVSFKVVYDARESAKTTPEWQECFAEVVRIVPGLVLAFFESVVMAAISVAVSTRLPMLPNLIICGSIYVLGHLAALIVKSSAGENVFVRFVASCSRWCCPCSTTTKSKAPSPAPRACRRLTCGGRCSTARCTAPRRCCWR